MYPLFQVALAPMPFGNPFQSILVGGPPKAPNDLGWRIPNERGGLWTKPKKVSGGFRKALHFAQLKAGLVLWERTEMGHHIGRNGLPATLIVFRRAVADADGIVEQVQVFPTHIDQL